MTIYSYLEALSTFRPRKVTASSETDTAVMAILKRVSIEQDKALFAYTQAFDKVTLTSLKVSQDTIKNAYQRVDQAVIASLLKAKKNIETYHQKQTYQAFEYERDGRLIGQKITPIRRVGLYIPGGTAAYPSSVLMNAVPAMLAGVNEIVLVSPPSQDGLISPLILVAADLCGIKEIYSVGGAQAIAALAYGTETIARVDKIVGPGNQFVTKAKALVSSFVGIDTVAGPSEVCIVADQDSNPTYIAADMLAQAEHDPLSRAICIANNLSVLQAVDKEITHLLKTLNRQAIAKTAIDQGGMLILVDNDTQVIELVDTIAPEHLELLTSNAWDLKDKITNAGAMFIGPYTPEPVGDYMAGPNHTLPTSGFARFASGLSTYDFLKRTSYVSYQRSAFESDKEDIIRLAEAEGLTAHALSMKVRK
jgi:histidinol dehydrogenase